MSKQAGKFSADGQDQHVAPLAVTGLTAVNVGGASLAYNAGAATVSWTLPSNSNPATVYTVTTSPATTTQTTILTSLNFPNLASGTAYTFTVVPSNSYGNGPSTTSSSVTITTIPAAPTMVSAVDQGSGRQWNQGQVQVSFTANQNGGANIDSYAVNAFDTSGNYLAQVIGSSSPLTFTTLNSNTTYKFAAYSHNSNGYSAASAFSGNVLVTTVPNQPSAPTLTSPSAGTDTVTWSAPNNGGQAITSYNYYDNGGAAVNAGNILTFNIGEGMGTNHYFQISAVNVNGTSAISAASTTVTTAFSFAPFSFTPFAFTPFSFAPIFAFTPFSFAPIFAFTPFSFAPIFSFAPAIFSFAPSVFSFAPRFIV
jgi:hypothetical protein